MTKFYHSLNSLIPMAATVSKIIDKSLIYPDQSFIYSKLLNFYLIPNSGNTNWIIYQLRLFLFLDR